MTDDLPENLLKSPLHDRHAALEAKFADVGGFAMPLSYRGAIDEASQVRRRAGIFDISHIGRLRIRGDGALDLLERVCTSDAAHQEDDTAVATCLCNEQGGIIDLCGLARLEDDWLLTTSAINRAKVLAHLRQADMGAKIDDQTEKTAMVAVCGPEAPALLDAVLSDKPSALPEGGARQGSMMLAKYIVVRKSMGGLWCLEVVLPNMLSGMAWDFITRKAGEHVIAPAGLAAMDILRIEAGLIAYGHEVNETIDPITAGLADTVAMNHAFIGAAAVGKLMDRPPARRRVGLILSPACTGIPRQGNRVGLSDGSEIGAVTSGTYSPALDRMIAMAYVSRETPDGSEVQVRLQDGDKLATVSSLPIVKG